MKLEASFWITNISNMNVSLADLNLTVKALTSVNLLDKKHYQYTPEQLHKSVESGSIFKKRDKLVVRKVAPELPKSKVSVDRENFIPSRERSIYSIKEENYEELDVSDEQFARENVDTVEMDNKPIKKA